MSALEASAARRLSGRVTASYGLGAVAYGIKDAAFGTFLLLFYNQVVGLNPGIVGLVIMFALILDALVDPAVGALSDRTRGRWGRRHPWMYFSAIPIAIGWILLWHPPQMSEGMTLVWLFATAVIVRSAVSCYEVPSQALTPELTSDYDERTRITAYRYLFGWAGGLTILLLAYRVFLVPTTDYPNGLLNPAGYHHLAVLSAVLMVIAILASALGTHSEIKHLPKVDVEKVSVAGHFRELWQTAHNRGFLVLMLAGICVYTNQGIGYALANYFYSYVWLFKGATLGLLPLALFIGAGLAFVIAPRIGRHTSKPKAATVFVLVAMVFQTAPYLLRFAGVLPPPGATWQVPILFMLFILSTACSVSSFILGASMMADVVEESEARTGRRSEGVFFAGSFFVQKCTSGIGIAMAGLILGLARFPATAKPGTVPVEAIDRLTLTYVGIYVVIAVAAAIMYSRFPFGRAEHEARLARMVASAEQEGVPHAP